MPEPSQDAGVDLSRESLQRLTGLLLAVSATLLAAVIALAAYIILERQQLATLKGSLLGQQQLQEELLANQASDNAAFPHLDQGISFVLNPAMRESTFKAGGTGPYRINRLGLRGPEITGKPAGVTRIALVGDSVLFGWKLAEGDKLASLLQAMAERLPGSGRYEFVTVAIPGWNVIDQERFLRNHLARLAPDYIIWSILRNDLLDSGGVVPPGVLMAWNAPQKTGQRPFQFLAPGLLQDAPAPVILSRWQANLHRIEEFARENEIPASLLWWRARHRTLFDHVLSLAGTELPVIHVPALYRYDESNWCVDPPDCHPTLWANERLAVGLMAELARRGIVEPPAWSTAEQQVIAAFEEEATRASTPEQQRTYLNAQAALTPQVYTPEDDGRAVLFGVREGRMARNGILLLRRQGAAGALTMSLAAPGDERPGPPQRIAVTVRTDQGREVQHTATLEAETEQLTFPVPANSGYGLYEIEWRFDHAECERPSACFSARLLEARLLDSPPGAD